MVISSNSLFDHSIVPFGFRKVFLRIGKIHLNLVYFTESILEWSELVITFNLFDMKTSSVVDLENLMQCCSVACYRFVYDKL